MRTSITATARDVLAGDLGLAEALFDQLPNVVFFVKDEEARYVAVNANLIGRCGVSSKAELIGHTAAEVFPEPIGTLFHEQDLSLLETGEPLLDRLELHLYTDGSHGWCLTTKLPIRDGNGTPIGIAGLSRDLHQPGNERSELEQVARAVDRIRTEYGDPLRVGELASSCGLTVSRLERAVKRIYKLTPAQLLAQTRLDAARKLLVTTDASVTEVAHRCGYTDHSAFSRQFRSSVGMTPTEFRSRPRED